MKLFGLGNRHQEEQEGTGPDSELSGQRDFEDDLSHLQLPEGTELDENFLTDDGLRNDALQQRSPYTPTHPLSPRFGIERATELMGKLPQGDIELIVQVVEKTLASMDVEVADIVIDAESKEQRLNEKHELLKEEIQGFERQIEDRNQQIESLLQELRETTDVKQKLQLSLNQKSADSPIRTKATPASPTEELNQEDNAVVVSQKRTTSDDEPAADMPDQLH
ncbi:hypothetical protein HBA55_27070 [Pseudomaricurvus alkylphenolicus]|jgi:hypothetical protein|uniref:hypothetical protein n=1 Tax=Pseudomaricurvus alkylphenolicus TaxID=1306991 RepID=UPI00141ECFA5|nr:hypothetical protein [Pseudomaricurvus alkylphenolicus]NIB43299.1 hypothetical protein [Pseudomaricurvus alkylphenolicus]